MDIIEPLKPSVVIPDAPASFHLLELCQASSLAPEKCQLQPGEHGRNYLRLLAALSELTDDESFHLSSRRMLPGTTRFILNNLYNCTTLKALLSQIASGFNFVHGGNYNLIQNKGRYLSYVIDDKDFNYHPQSQPEHIRIVLDSALVLVHGIVKTTCPEARLVSLDSRSNHESVLPWLFPINVLHQPSDFYRLHYAAECADYRVNAKNLNQVSMTQLYLNAYEISATEKTESCVERVLKLMQSGQFHQDSVADKLHMSAATLRRKLSDEGTTFRQLCEQQRNKLAHQLLRVGITREEISQQLGFADERSFNRAFKQWNGVTPCEFSGPVSSSVTE